ncbi:MAG: hypothetical protein ACRDWT_11150 [Jatrophihabitantaceae bacterium]
MKVAEVSVVVGVGILAMFALGLYTEPAPADRRECDERAVIS